MTDDEKQEWYDRGEDAYWMGIDHAFDLTAEQSKWWFMGWNHAQQYDHEVIKGCM